LIAADSCIRLSVLELEEGSRFGGFLAAVDVGGISIAAPIVVVVGALCD
jgi:hypothetical protein